MKHIVTLAFAAIIAIATINNSNAKGPKTTKKETRQTTNIFVTKDSVFHFGKIELGKPVTTSFVFFNKGSKPVIIKSVNTSCGCTTPTWEGKPVLPGKSTIIKVGYNAATVGSFNKTIVVNYDKNSQQNIYIEGEVTP